jgi:hypothetical protein
VVEHNFSPPLPLIRRQTAELENATALLQISQTEERDIDRETEKHVQFERAYARWLRARGALEGNVLAIASKAAAEMVMRIIIREKSGQAR